MKRFITYTLVFLMFITVNFQSVCYLMYKIGHTLELAPGFLSEEERHESEETPDSELKKKETDFLSFSTEVHFINLPALTLRPEKDESFVCSNFSGTIYTPPDYLHS